MLRCIIPDSIAPGEKVVLVVRPEDIDIIADPQAEKENVLRGEVEAVVFMGDVLECQLSVGKQKLRMKLHPSSRVQQGQDVSLHLPPEHCRALRGS
jgi:iron(III) transport system ATP-binding protein